MIEIFLFLLLGCVLGIITGMIPGIHPNTIVLIVPFLVLTLSGTSLYSMIAFIVAMSVTNSITDFIPSILLGAPDPSVALSVLPGHRLLMQGQAYKAIKLTVIGGVIAVLTITILSPLFATVLPYIYLILRQYLAYMLLFVLAIIVVLSKKYILTISIMFFAALLGIASMNLSFFNSLGTLSLFPLLTGLFALPLLYTQIKQETHIPEQFVDTKEQLLNKENILSAIVGALAGMFSGILPGVGASQAAMLSGATAGEQNTDRFLVRIGAITTSNIILSFMALWLISQPRSGAAIAVQQLIANVLEFGINEFIFIIVIVLISGAIAAKATMFLAKIAINNITRFNYNKLSLYMFIILNILILLLTGPIGIILAWLATAIGIVAIRVNVLRTSLMAALIIPTALIYLGILL